MPLAAVRRIAAVHPFRLKGSLGRQPTVVFCGADRRLSNVSLRQQLAVNAGKLVTNCAALHGEGVRIFGD